MRARAAAALALACGGALAGCGLPTDSSPRNIAQSEQPISLPTNPPVSAGDPSFSGPRVWFLIDNEGLELRDASRDVSTDAGDLLASLLQGPSADEARQGIDTAIPVGTRLLNIQPPDLEGTLVVDLSGEFLTLQGTAVGNALGQIVFTATEDRDVKRVVVTVEGEALPWTVGDVTFPPPAPLNRLDFDDLDPTQFPEPGLPPPTAPPTSRPATTTTREPPPGVD